MHRSVWLLCVMGLVNAPALADQALFGRTLYTPPGGQPLCHDVESLAAYVAATQRHDQDHIIAGCHIIGPGKEVVVTQDIPLNSDVMHVVRLRVFGVPVQKRLGYSVSTGLQGHR